MSVEDLELDVFAAPGCGGRQQGAYRLGYTTSFAYDLAYIILSHAKLYDRSIVTLDDIYRHSCGIVYQGFCYIFYEISFHDLGPFVKPDRRHRRRI